MRQSQLIGFLLALGLIIVIGISGCGGGSSSTTTTGPTMTVSPTSLSMNFGQFVQLTPTILDANGTQIFTLTPTYASNDANVAVSTGGLVCAGTWDSLTAPTVCQATNVAAATGAIITVTAGSLTVTVPVSLHNRIARVTLTAAAGPACASQGATQQFTAQAFDSINPTVPLTNPGTFTYSSTDATVATVDATNGLATAVQPGSVKISASLNSVFSLPITLTDCAPASITLSPTSFTGAVSASQQLTATVVDTVGNPITGVALTYSSSQVTVAGVTSSGFISAVGAGSAGVIASCSPPTCNKGAAANVPVYSNLVSTTVTGSSATTVYVTGATSTTIVPIDATTNVAGTAITIPVINNSQPVINSLVFDKSGSTAYIGTNTVLIPLNPATNALGTTLAVPGKVLAISPDSKKVIVADQTPTAPQTFVVDVATSTFAKLGITTVSTAADFSADSLKAYIVSNGNATLSIFSPVLPFQALTLNAAANDVTFLSQGSLGYLAGGTANSITARATCDNSLVSTVGTTATPLLIKSNFDSSRVFGVDGSRVYDVTVSNIATPANGNCPPTASNSLNTVLFGSTVTPKQMILTSDGVHMYVTNDSNKVLTYNAATRTTSSITLQNSATATTTGGATLDGAQVYVGALGSNDVHRIDVNAGTDAQQIAVTLKDSAGAAVSPDFVAVRPK
jgi:uncharacterized protein YjdB